MFWFLFFCFFHSSCRMRLHIFCLLPHFVAQSFNGKLDLDQLLDCLRISFTVTFPSVPSNSWVPIYVYVRAHVCLIFGRDGRLDMRRKLKLNEANKFSKLKHCIEMEQTCLWQLRKLSLPSRPNNLEQRRREKERETEKSSVTDGERVSERLIQVCTLWSHCRFLNFNRISKLLGFITCGIQCPRLTIGRSDSTCWRGQNVPSSWTATSTCPCPPCSFLPSPQAS